MKSFGLLLGLAFVDLAIAGIMIGRGERGVALAFIVIAVLTAAFALFAKPELRRDPRGRLQPVEPPFARVLGIAGAVAILGAAAYVAVSTGRPLAEQVPRSAKPAPFVAPVAPPAQAAGPRPAPVGNWLHKCTDASGHTSFQSAPCPAGSRQDWRRPVTPEREPTRTARTGQLAPSASQSNAGQGSSGWSRQRVRKEDSVACQAARDADRRYRQQPLSQVTHDGLRQHGDAIRSACG
ncbi:hypothetical protein GCM10027193_16960 [Arenimonas aestuarii]